MKYRAKGLAFGTWHQGSEGTVFVIHGINNQVVVDHLPPQTVSHRTCQEPTWIRPILQAVAATGRRGVRLSTDGSSRHKQVTCTDIYNDTDSMREGQGAILITDYNSDRSKGGQSPICVVRLTHIPKVLSTPHKVELLALIVAKYLALYSGEAAHIETDCQSLLRQLAKELPRHGERSLTTQECGKLHQTLRELTVRTPGVTVSHIKAHVEARVTDRGLWTDAQIRNYIADAYAEMESDDKVLCRLYEAERKHPSLPHLKPRLVLKLDAREVLRDMFSDGEFFYATEDGVPIVTNPFNRQCTSANEYLVKRETYSTAHSGYAWAVSAPTFVAK